MRNSYITDDIGLYTPGSTPRSVKLLIIITCLCTLGIALLDPLFTKIFNNFGPLYYLGLSKLAFEKLYLWQPVSYFFILQGFSGINLFTIINLAFAIYLMWIFGSIIAKEFGELSFLRFYITTGILTGLASLVWMSFFGQNFLVGNTACLFALFIVWSMLYPDSEILLFFIFPCKTRWLVAGVLGISALIYLSEGNGLSFLQIICGTISGYLWGTMVFKLHSPFPFTYAIDQKLNAWGGYMSEYSFRKKKKDKSDSKIVNIQTGKSMETNQEDLEDQFVDEMLAKISKDGEQSLTRGEREKLDAIAAKKKKK